MTRTKKIVLYVVAAIAVAALVIVANSVRNESQVKGLRVLINYNDADTLITSACIKQTLGEEMSWIQRQKVKEIDEESITNCVLKSPYIKDCHTSVSVNGIVVVKATQRRPIVRMFLNDEEFYLDDQCKRMPASKEGNGNVIVANAASRCTNAEALNLFHVAKYFDEQPEFGVLFDQIYLDNHKDICLVPKLGDQIVVIGDMNNMDKKMQNLCSFYKTSMPQMGWETYKTINLKYNNQVICTRKEQ